jgi:hypothetical protein
MSRGWGVDEHVPVVGEAVDRGSLVEWASDGPDASASQWYEAPDGFPGSAALSASTYV